MGIKRIDGLVGSCRGERRTCGVGLYETDEPYAFEVDLEDSTEPAIWPRGEDDSEDLPPAPGRCRRVAHDW